jgi:hypothetical protein
MAKAPVRFNITIPVLFSEHHISTIYLRHRTLVNHASKPSFFSI